MKSRTPTTAADRAKPYATERQLTGTPYIHHGYVREGKRVIASCTHPHGARGRRGAEKAMRCAESMLRRVLRERATR